MIDNVNVSMEFLNETFLLVLYDYILSNLDDALRNASEIIIKSGHLEKRLLLTLIKYQPSGRHTLASCWMIDP